MILLDTHIWIWFADESNQLTKQHRHAIEHQRADGLGVSAISCWEIAKLVEYNRLELACPIEEWMKTAITLPDVQLIELTPRIAIASTKLPGNFHRDPADQIIVATAQVYDIELLTVDERILKYEHVRTM
ncbi:PIN domain nuclease [Candidatus Desantisbacteria bacterium CG_4_9_14_3_um_filter_40_11]|uniref:PIN domain nuclease n=2 Tax=unclassified Candidatus Desantisiibacteriota TaxID=3106372 RepID=A0A2M8ATD3_9BACT|nr:MAG: PIN domain nuclease [Candidatus Desantisbacteria bacterium CG23_combo_of_CG06-09_8_20_14_all_40_23]PJB29460.1 MAG: PIN domain nuclease [Candidatus Desantisbacteria bacterium CG_4_9_14_3_um_filter_40_11]